VPQYDIRLISSSFLAANLAKPKSQTCQKARSQSGSIGKLFDKIVAHLDTIILSDEQILALQVSVQTVPRMQVRDRPRYIDCETQPEPPGEVEVLIDDVAAQIAIGQILGDDEDPTPSGERRLCLSCIVECQGWEIVWRRRGRQTETDKLDNIGMTALSANESPLRMKVRQRLSGGLEDA
jgi:hypothetical protein